MKSERKTTKNEREKSIKWRLRAKNSWKNPKKRQKPSKSMEKICEKEETSIKIEG